MDQMSNTALAVRPTSLPMPLSGSLDAYIQSVSRVPLLTPEEEMIDLRTMHLRFDIGLLAERLVAATDWLTQYPDTRHLRVGYFGASTGAAAALVSAAERPQLVGAVVSRGGRPDAAVAN